MAQKAYFTVTDLCNALEVSTSGYYAWCKRKPSQRELDDAQLLKVIKVLFKTHRETYGSPRIHDALKELGHRVGENRVARIMQENDLSALPKRVWRCVTTKADPTHPVAENELNRDFTATDVNAYSGENEHLYWFKVNSKKSNALASVIFTLGVHFQSTFPAPLS